MSNISGGISDGNPDVNSVADSEWTVVRSVLGLQFHVPLGKMPMCVLVWLICVHEFPGCDTQIKLYVRCYLDICEACNFKYEIYVKCVHKFTFKHANLGLWCTWKYMS